MLVSVSVRGWVGKEGSLIFGIFEAAPESPEDLPLSILTRRPHKELCLRNPARSEERTKDVSQSEPEGQSVKDEIPEMTCLEQRSSQSGVESQ